MAQSVFDLNQLQVALPEFSLEHHCELASTSDRASQLAKDASAELPLLVLADRQTAGRGRSDHRWWAQSGALTFTLLIDGAQLGLNVKHLPAMGPAMGVAVCQAIEPLLGNQPPQLKWPNDVLVAGKKLAGILIESPGPAMRVTIGIGLNVNNSFDQAPEEVQSRATSLAQIVSRPLNLNDVLLAVMASCQERLQELASESDELAKRWNHLSYLTGRNIQISSAEQSTQGLCCGIGTHGELLLQVDGKTQAWHSGTIDAIE